MAVRLSALRDGRPLPQVYSWYSFLLEVESTPGHNAAERIYLTEIFIDPIGSRTRDFPASSIVPQPTTLPRALHLNSSFRISQYYSDELLAGRTGFDSIFRVYRLLCPLCNEGSYFGGKPAEAWRWPLTFIECQA
jgi:hypothetical protein